MIGEVPTKSEVSMKNVHPAITIDEAKHPPYAYLCDSWLD